MTDNVQFTKTHLTIIEDLIEAGGHQSYCDLVQFQLAVACTCDWDKAQTAAWEFLNKSTVTKKERSWEPGRVQLQVLGGLANDDASVRTLAMNWPGLSESSVRSAVMSLSSRSLVDAVRFEGNERIWGLTHKGSEWVESRWGDDVPEDLDD